MGKGLICNCITICMQLHDLAPRYIYVGFILADIAQCWCFYICCIHTYRFTANHWTPPLPDMSYSPTLSRKEWHKSRTEQGLLPPGSAMPTKKQGMFCCVTAVFQCTATGTLPLTFIWWRNITNYSFMGRWIYSWWWETDGTVTERVNSNDTCFIQMVNDSTSQLSFSNTSMPIFEEYFCEVSDTCGQSSRSEPALLLVYEGKIDDHTWCHYHLTFIWIIHLSHSL